MAGRPPLAAALATTTRLGQARAAGAERSTSFTRGVVGLGGVATAVDTGETSVFYHRISTLIRTDGAHSGSHHGWQGRQLPSLDATRPQRSPPRPPNCTAPGSGTGSASIPRSRTGSATGACSGRTWWCGHRGLEGAGAAAGDRPPHCRSPQPYQSHGGLRRRPLLKHGRTRWWPTWFSWNRSCRGSTGPDSGLRPLTLVGGDGKPGLSVGRSAESLGEPGHASASGLAP